MPLGEEAGERLERPLAALLRRALSVRLSDDATPVERTSYALLAALHDDGPERLSDLARVVRLEKSSVFRQLAGLVARLDELAPVGAAAGDRYPDMSSVNR